MQEQIFNTSLSLIQSNGWNAFELRMVAEKLGVPLEDVHAYLAHKDDLCRLGCQVLQAHLCCSITPEELQQAAPKERLLESILLYFEYMAPHKTAVKSMIKAPFLALKILPLVRNQALFLLNRAGLETNGVIGFAKVQVLSSILVATFWAWLKDNSKDLSKTTAFLDRLLTLGDQQMERYA